jgi:hypothetical protein
MNVPPDTVRPYSANPFVFLFSIAAIVAVSLYFAYGAVDRMGLEVRSIDATVVDKQYNPSRQTYNTTIAAGRVWTQAYETSGSYVVTLRIDGEQTVGLVSKQLFDSLKTGDRLQAKIRRTRFSRRLETLDVTRDPLVRVEE